MPVIQSDELASDLHFPKAGIDLSQAMGRQPNRAVGITQEYARSTPDGVNVLAFDRGGRSRGGCRPGTSKYDADPIGPAGWIAQHLDTFVTTEGTVMPTQVSQSGRLVYLVGVSQGLLKWKIPGVTGWTTPTNLSASTPPLIFTGLMRSAPNNQKLYIVDGVNFRFFDPHLDTMNTWVATAGTLPVDADGNAPRLICTWRGRTIMAGLLLDPQNYFASAVSDPTDFDYSPLSITATQAFAGNNSPLGLIGDVITALIPYTDDVLIFGGDSSIYMMRGDPLAGGQIHVVSKSIGIAWGEAWVMDPEGIIYFMSNRTGIYALIPGQQPQRISQAIEQLLVDIDTGLNGVRMLWNDRFQGLHVFVTPLEAPADTTHFFWEKRSGSWFKWKFANHNHDPLCCVTFDGNLPTDRVPLIGCWDGYVRAIDPLATDDDGTAIASSVWIGPLTSKTLDELRLDELQAVLANGSGAVSYDVYVGETPELAFNAAAPFCSGTLTADRNVTEFIRASGHAIYLKLSSTVQWAMETIRARFEATTGPARRRRWGGNS